MVKFYCAFDAMLYEVDVTDPANCLVINASLIAPSLHKLLSRCCNCPML